MDPTQHQAILVNDYVYAEDSPLLNPQTNAHGNGYRRTLSRKDYISILILCLDTMCLGISFALISSFYPIIAKKEKGLSDGDVGIVFSAFPVATILLSLVLSKYVDKIGTRRMLLAGLVIMVLASLPFAFVLKLPTRKSFYAVSVVSRAIQGSGFVSGQIATFSIVANEYKDQMSTVMGLLEMSLSVGVAMGPAIGGFLSDSLGFAAPFYTLMGFCTLFFGLTIIFMQSHSDITDSAGESNDDSSLKIPMNFKTFLVVPILLVPMVASAISFMNLTLFDVGLATFMNTNFFLSSTYIGLIFFASALVYSISAPLTGYICDKKGHYGFLVILGFFISCPAFLFIGPVPFFSLEHHLWSSILNMIIMFIGSALMYVPALGLCFKIIQLYNIDDSSSAQSFLTSTFVFSGNVGNLVGPFAGGFLISEFGFGMTAGIFGIVTLFMGILSGLALIVVFKRRQS